ncbi:MAG: hypothetical protein AAF842_10705 [Planctomycetota bacterium]
MKLLIVLNPNHERGGLPGWAGRVEREARRRGWLVRVAGHDPLVPAAADTLPAPLAPLRRVIGLTRYDLAACTDPALLPVLKQRGNIARVTHCLSGTLRDHALRHTLDAFADRVGLRENAA